MRTQFEVLAKVVHKSVVSVCEMSAPPPPPPLLTASAIPTPVVKKQAPASIQSLPFCKVDYHLACSYDIFSKDIDWHKDLKSASWLSGGDDSRGVSLFEYGSDQTFLVIKGSFDIASEIFSSLLGREFFHLEIPRSRLIHHNDKDLKDWNQIRSIPDLFSPTDQRKWKLCVHRHYLAVMEFANGLNLDSLDKFCVQEILDTNPQYCIDLGVIFIFDLLISNWDRIPGTIFDHQGNLGNIILDPVKKRLVPIDNQVSSFSSAYLPIHLSKIQDFIKSVLKLHESDKYWNDQSPSVITEICKSLQSATLQEVIPEKCKKSILEGLVLGIEKVTAIKNEDLVQLKERVNAMNLGPDYRGEWKVQIDQINIESMIAVKNTICQVINEKLQ